MRLVLDGPRSAEGITVLAIGAHSDDIEIGCGGTVLSLLRTRQDVTVHWVVLSAPGRREEEARRAADRMLRGARDVYVHTYDFRDGFFPFLGGAVKEVFEDLKATEPDVVLSHHLEDRHQDHRHVAELTWNTFRRHLVLEYEVPKYDGRIGAPNLFVPLSDDVAREKVSVLMEAFASQRSKSWFTEDTFLGLMRLRGIENSAAEVYAEAFFGRKLVVGL